MNFNVALNRPTVMSSTYSDPALGGAFASSRAVDGNRDTVAMKVDGSCFRTLADNYPWWSVDLGRAVAVVGVLFANRGEGWGDCTLLQ